ncbi:MAG: NAD/NADP octopine/nopaline dehydrogenase family protein [Thaumarchaeota archaeon]|nr:NAD/NADP octopine/nopaline dehydrogenase family protein [Nitrososphaerota archaeon]
MSERLSIAVCGGGRAGTAIAADLALMGHDVRLFELARLRTNVEGIRRKGGIDLTGDTQSGKTGFARLSSIGSDPEEAVENADMIMITAPAFGHQAFFEAILPFLVGGEKVVFNTGYWSSLRFSPLLTEAGLDEVVIAETNIMPYAAEKLGPVSTHILRKKREMKLAAFPGNRTGDTFSIFRKLYPQTKRVPNVLWTNFAAGNPPIHAPMTIPIAGKVFDGRKSFNFYSEASEPGARLVEACDEERLRVASRLGVESESEFDWFKKTYGYGGRNIAEALRKSEHAAMPTPVEFHNALLREDIGYFYVPLTAMADQVDEPATISRAVVEVIGALQGIDYWSTGLTLKQIGLEGLSPKQMVERVNRGQP